MTDPQSAEAVRAGDARACGLVVVDEAGIVKRTLAAAYRQQAGWTDDSHAIHEMLSLASQVEAFEPGDACCPCCQEITCDAGCPLEPVRSQS